MNSGPYTKVINYFLLLAAFIMCISLVMYGYAVTKTPRLNVSNTLSNNMFFIDKLSDAEIRYYNGNTFVAMNPTTRKTGLLSQYRMLPDVNQVFWLTNGVVFATTEVSTFSELNPILQNELVNNPGSRAGDTPTYWYLSFQDQLIRPISNDVVQPASFGVLASDGSFVFKDGPEGSYSILKENGEVILGAVNVEGDSKPLFATDKKLIYTSQVEERSSNRESESVVSLKSAEFYKEDSKTIVDDLFEDKTSTVFGEITSIDETRYLINRAVKRDKPGGGDLYIYDTKSKKSNRIIKDFEGVVSKNSSGVVAVKQGRKFNVVHRVESDGVKDRARFEREEHQTVASTTHFDGGYILSSGNGKSFFIHKDGVKTDLLGKDAYGGALEKEIQRLPNNNRLLRDIESPYDTSYTLQFNGKSRDALGTLQAAISSKGYDPNQFIITLTPGRSVEY